MVRLDFLMKGKAGEEISDLYWSPYCLLWEQKGFVVFKSLRMTFLNWMRPWWVQGLQMVVSRSGQRMPLRCSQASMRVTVFPDPFPIHKTQIVWPSRSNNILHDTNQKQLTNTPILSRTYKSGSQKRLAGVRIGVQYDLFR